MARGVESLRVKIAMALATVNELFLNARLIVFVTAAYSAAVVAVKSMSTNGLVVLQNVATHAQAPTGSVEIHPVDVRLVKCLAGSQGICCVDWVRDCWAEEIALALSHQQIADVATAAVLSLIHI